MERKEAMLKTGYVRIFWAVLVILLCAAPALRADVTVPAGEIWDINYLVSGSLWVEGTANLLPGASVEWFVYTISTSVVNIEGGTVGWVIDVAAGAQVTVYGTYFEIDGSEYYPGDEVSISYYTDGPLTVVYEGGTQVDLPIDCQPGATVTLAAPGGGDPAQMIQDLIDTVEDLNAKNGIINSLDAKLDAALKALIDVNANNDAAAINTLQAFISAVEAQSGNQIDATEADELIDAAQAIIDLLST